MNKFKFLLAFFTLTATSAFAQDLHYELGYTTVGGDDADISIDLGALYGSVGYDFNVSGNLTNSVEALFAFGIQDDSLFGADISLDPSYEVAYRGMFETSTPELSFFGRVAYGNYGFEIEGFGASESADDSGAGVGVGATWKGFTLGYTQYLGDLEDLSRINIGFRF